MIHRIYQWLIELVARLAILFGVRHRIYQLFMTIDAIEARLARAEQGFN